MQDRNLYMKNLNEHQVQEPDRKETTPRHIELNCSNQKQTEESQMQSEEKDMLQTREQRKR